MRSGYVIFPQANVESEPSPLPDAERMRRELDLVDLAGELGFEEFWVTEHHFGDYNLAPSPLQLLSYVAGRFPARRSAPWSSSSPGTTRCGSSSRSSSSTT